jgi:RNA polymerase-binding protein DksA
MELASHSLFDKYVLLQFKSGLREQQCELQQSLEQAEKTIRELAGSGPRDLADAASGNSLEGSVIAESSQSRIRLRLIELALERIRSGAFGACADCGAAIGLRRLQAIPWTSHCIRCQERHEQGDLAGAASSSQPVPA